MKSQRIIKETIKSEKLPQGQKSTSIVTKKYQSSSSGGGGQVTVKETTIEKSYKSTYKAEEGSNNKNVSISSTIKQGTNLASSSQNKITTTSNKEETSQSKFSKYRNYGKYKSGRKGQEYSKEKQYSKKDVDMIIKIQRWWKRILAKLNGYKIREKLRKEKASGYVTKNREVVREKYFSSSSTSQKKDTNIGKTTITNKISTNTNYKISNNTNKNVSNQVNSNTSSYSNINSYSKYSGSNLQKNEKSKSYNNISSIKTTVKKDLNVNTNLTTSSSQNYIQTNSKQSIAYPKYAGSVSTSPSVKNKYLIETKKVEIFKRPKNYSASKSMSKNTITTMSEINRYEVKDIIQKIWNEESYCSTVESLCCLSDGYKSNDISQNNMIFEEYEEEIRRLKTLLMEKDDEINNLINNLNETKNQLNVKYTSTTSTYDEYVKNKYDQDAHGLQIIKSKQSNWNEVNLPSPVSEIYIESFRIGGNAGLAYNMEKYSEKIRKEESARETISDSEAVLEIQEMNALSILSNKMKPKNICQHLQSLMILSKKNEEEEPLIFQKIEEINITSIVNKPRNQIQELDGLEIISMKRLARNVAQNVDKICLKPLKEVHNMIQELDGLEILKLDKAPHIPQCVDELEIPREYDMLLVKPTWNSLQIQGSGLNLLALSRDMALENQEIDEFEILGKEKPVPSMQSLDKITIIRAPKPQKIQVLVPVPQNSIKKGERFGYKGIRQKPEIKKMERFSFRGIKKKPEIKYIERFIKENKEIVPNEVVIIDRIELIGEEKPVEVKIEKKEVKVEKKVIPNKVLKNDRFMIKGKEKVKEEYVPVKRKGFVEKINKQIITKKEEKKEEEKKPEPKPEPKPLILEIENIESLEINKEYETVQPIVLEKIDWTKVTRPIKSTKLVIKGIPHVEKEKEELVIENFAFNLAETSKGFKGLLLVKIGGINIEGNKGIVLKEGPAQTIVIKKEQILSPSKTERFDLITQIKKPELITVSENRIRINAQYQVKMDKKESVKIVEKIIEKKINWNEFNIIEHNDFNIIHIKPKIKLIKQTISSISLIGEEMPEPKKEIPEPQKEIPKIPQPQKEIVKEIVEKEKIIRVTKDWKNLLQAQRNAKFCLIGKPKQGKKYKLLVANGDKFFIQKESDDEIIYNDDYNTRKQKQRAEKKEKVEIIKEKEIIPRYQREIRAQIARVKESESETSSLSEIDVLAGIRNKSVIGVGGADAELLRQKIANGYEVKFVSGEYEYTSKNGLGIQLGGSQYQKQYKRNINYTKKLSSSLSSNKMTGIEIKINPRIKTGVHFEKMSATSGTIGEGNYKIHGENRFNIDNDGQSSIRRQVIITSTESNEINGQPKIILNNRLSGQKSASNILIKKRESNKSNESPVSANINNDINQQVKIGKVIFNSKKDDKGQFSPNSTGNISGKNIIVNSRKENEKRIAKTGDRNLVERMLNEKKKNVEIKFKKSKVKNVEPLRDYDSQNSY